MIHFKKLLIGFYLLFTLSPQASECMANQSTDLLKFWKQKKSSRFYIYSRQQLTMAESLFEQLLQEGLDSELGDKLAELDLAIEQKSDFLIISGQGDNTGQGVYIIRKSSARPVLLQSPHAYHDMKTGVIGVRLMQENNYQALAINTAHRYSLSENGNADVAHLNESLFLSFSRAFARVYPVAKVIQLHGFNAARREQTKHIDFILSNASRYADPSLFVMRDCLNLTLQFQSQVYPHDISLLGGTANIIGQQLRIQGFSGFRHIEISLNARKALAKYKKVRRLFSKCIAK